MVDDEQTPDGPEAEGPRRKTYTPPDESAVFTGSFPVVDEDALNSPIVASEPVAPEAPTQARAATDPPIRQSLSDTEIMARFQGPDAGTTAEMILELERQVSLRQDEEEAFTMWANLVRATRGDDAEAIIQRERIIFDGGELEDDELPQEKTEEAVLEEAEIPEGVAELVSEELTGKDSAAEELAVEEPAEVLASPEEVAPLEDLTVPEDQWPLQQARDEPEEASQTSEDVIPAQRVQSPVTAGLVWMWSASIAPVLGIVAGAFLISRGAGFLDAVIAVVAGGLIAGLVIALGARATASAGVATISLAAETFGSRGTLVPSAILVLLRVSVVALALVGAVGIAHRVLDISGLWPLERWIALAALGVVVVGATVALGILGGRVLRMALWISAGLGLAGLVGFVVVNLGVIASVSVDLAIGEPLALVGTVALVVSGLLVLFAHTGGDLSAVRPGSGRPVSGLLVALGALMPLAVMAVSSALVASANPRLALTLVTDPVGSLVVGLPSWYPAPALLVLVLPLIGFAAFLLFTAGRAAEVFVGAGRTRVGVAITGALAVIAAAAVVVFEVNVLAFFPDVLIAGGVVVAGWAGAFAAGAALATGRPAVSEQPSSVQPASVQPASVQFAPLVGMFVAIALGFGLISSGVSWLSWQGYLLPVLSQWGLIDLSPGAPGVFVALGVSALVALIAGLIARRKESVSSDD